MKKQEKINMCKKRKWLAIGIILLFVGVTIAPTINFNTVKASQQNLINERINQRELLFQTICDIVNNKEIQLIIIKSQISRGISPPSEIPVITKNQLKQMYVIGLILSKIISKSRIQSMIGKYQLDNQQMQKEISTIIEKDATLNAELTQLKDSDCDCENENTTQWKFPVICSILLILIFTVGAPTYFCLSFFLYHIFGLDILYLFAYMILPIINIGAEIVYGLGCFWVPF